MNNETDNNQQTQDTDNDLEHKYVFLTMNLNVKQRVWSVLMTHQEMYSSTALEQLRTERDVIVQLHFFRGKLNT